MKFSKRVMLVAFSTILFASTSLHSFAANDPQVIEIHAKKFGYSPTEITLKKGVAYQLHLTSDDVPHSFRIKELGINYRMVSGQFKDVMFTPDKVGDFKVDCGIYCGEGHKTMMLTLHVVEK